MRAIRTFDVTGPGSAHFHRFRICSGCGDNRDAPLAFAHARRWNLISNAVVVIHGFTVGPRIVGGLSAGIQQFCFCRNVEARPEDVARFQSRFRA